MTRGERVKRLVALRETESRIARLHQQQTARSRDDCRELTARIEELIDAYQPSVGPSSAGTLRNYAAQREGLGRSRTETARRLGHLEQYLETASEACRAAEKRAQGVEKLADRIRREEVRDAERKRERSQVFIRKR
ncbi:hypothetical protein ACSMXM_11130 [Pacificimonas sp. ICDLI1SI03]|jgi:flagellar biosynthesis chaperone FliJ|tara:strand:+ start:42618 stop:43025 length:408 start_codon:yes stop_codon:yes gene_type:complete